MKQPGDRTSLAGVVTALFCLTIVVSLVTSFIVVKTLVPTVVVYTPIVTPNVSARATPTAIPSTTPVTMATGTPFDVYTPMKIDMPQIEGNLLQNSRFEDGLSGWTYSDELNPDKFAGVRVFETTGVNGKAYCSRRYEVNPQALDKAIVAFAQEIPVDPRGSYFFGGWVKLSNAVNVTVGVQEYDWSQLVGTGLAAPRIGIPPSGVSTNGWVFIHGEVPGIYPAANRLVFGLWHGEPANASGKPVDSTICVDDFVFGEIVK